MATKKASAPTVDVPVNNANLFGFDEPATAPVVQKEFEDIPIDLIDAFPNHPFSMPQDKIKSIAESIKVNGLFEPVILRPNPAMPGRYQAIAGHCRIAATRLNGDTTIKARVDDEMTDERAVILMVDTNLERRDEIKISERAKALQMKMEAVKAEKEKLGKAAPTAGMKSREAVAAETGDSAITVERYCRLTRLIPDVLELVDSGKIKFVPAVALATLTEKEQLMLLNHMQDNKVYPTPEQAEKIKAASEAGELNSLLIASYLEKPEVAAPKKVTIKAEAFAEICGSVLPAKEMETKIMTWGQTYSKVAAMMPNATDEQISNTIVSAVQKQLARDRAKANDLER